MSANARNRLLVFIVSVFECYYSLLRSTQDTAIFILVVDTLFALAALGSEIEIAMEVEDERLVEILHLCVLRIRRKC